MGNTVQCWPSLGAVHVPGTVQWRQSSICIRVMLCLFPACSIKCNEIISRADGRAASYCLELRPRPSLDFGRPPPQPWCETGGTCSRRMYQLASGPSAVRAMDNICGVKNDCYLASKRRCPNETVKFLDCISTVPALQRSRQCRGKLIPRHAEWQQWQKLSLQHLWCRGSWRAGCWGRCGHYHSASDAEAAAEPMTA
jgi:hypothetical protein